METRTLEVCVSNKAEELIILSFRFLVFFSRHKTALGGSACAVRSLQTNTEGEARMGGEGEDNKKPRLPLEPGFPPRTQSCVNSPRCWIILGYIHWKHTRTTNLAPSWLIRDQIASSFSHLGATSQTRWRTRPCLSVQRPAHKRYQLPPIQVEAHILRLANVSANISTGVQCGWSCSRPPPDLTWSVVVCRVAGSVRLFRVLRSTPSPPAQTSLQGFMVNQCACAAAFPLPVPSRRPFWKSQRPLASCFMMIITT